MKKLFAMLLAAVMLLTMMPLGAAAAETEITTQATAIEETYVMPRASSIPTEAHSLPYTATITNLEEGHKTYTRYYFSPVEEKIKIAGTVYSCGDDLTKNRTVKINLYRVGNSAIEDSVTYTFSENHYVSYSFLGLNDNAYYYIEIVNQTSNSLLSDLWVEGSFTIYY